MTRRESLAALLAAGFAPGLRADSRMQRLFGSAQGVAIAIDFRSKRLVASHRLEIAQNLVVPPGSTLKPLVLKALLDSGKISAELRQQCAGNLKIGGRSFACIHPAMPVALTVAKAISYSCNDFVAHAAGLFSPGELASALARYGLTSRTQLAGAQSESTGVVTRAETREATQLQALGEERVAATALEMAVAYHRLASQLANPAAEVILQGLEAAVEYGTARKAEVPFVKVAGKTGSAADRMGSHWAWFAGFAPSRDPKVVAVVLVQAYSGGADAAPIGGRIIAEHLAGHL